MRRMFDFLSNNGPWDQLIKLDNIALQKIQNELTIKLNSRISITPILVPHRDEYSETVCYLVSTMKKKLLYIPGMVLDFGLLIRKQVQRMFNYKS